MRTSLEAFHVLFTLAQIVRIRPSSEVLPHITIKKLEGKWLPTNFPISSGIFLDCEGH